MKFSCDNAQCQPELTTNFSQWFLARRRIARNITFAVLKRMENSTKRDISAQMDFYLT